MQTESYYIRCAIEHVDHPYTSALFLKKAVEARRLHALKVQEVADWMEAHEPVELHFCCGEDCPGLPYRASDQKHPASCCEKRGECDCAGTEDGPESPEDRFYGANPKIDCGVSARDCSRERTPSARRSCGSCGRLRVC